MYSAVKHLALEVIDQVETATFSFTMYPRVNVPLFISILPGMELFHFMIADG